MIRRREKREGIVPRDYWGPVWTSPMSLMNDMDRLFDDFRNEWESLFLSPRLATSEMTRAPLVDLSDTGEGYVLKAEVPGVNREDISIEVSENGIEISGETKVEKKQEDEEEGYLRRERRYTSFYRSIPLPQPVLSEKADAELADGVLTIKIPKAAPPEKTTKKVQVK